MTTSNKISILAICLFVFFTLFSATAEASLILQRPLYIGLNEGLVGYWSFDGPDMAQGTNEVTAFDRSGQGNHGTLFNTATSSVRVPGKIGQALEFDGVNDRVNLGAGSSLKITGAITVSAWVFFDTIGSGGSVNPSIVSKKGSNGNRSWAFQVAGVDSQPQFDVFVDGTDAGGSANANYITSNLTGRWIHFVGTYEPSVAVRIYENGELKNSDTTSVPASQFDSTLNPLIGARPDLCSSCFTDGLIDDVRVYNRVLSPDEIKRLYRIGATLKINTSLNNSSLTSGLVGYWSFDGPDMAQGTNEVTAFDRSGQGNHGTLFNTATSSVRVPGKIGQALEFDGVDDFINLGDPMSLQLTGAMSLSVWVYLDQIGSGNFVNPRFISKNGAAGNRGWDIEMDNPNSVTFLISSDGTASSQAAYNESNPTGRWIHFVGVYDPGVAVRLYADGDLKDANTISIPTSQFNSSSNVNIGRKPTAGASFINGKIDDVRVYNRALSAEEIKRLYRIGATFKVNVNVSRDNPNLNEGLVGYWSFDGPDMAQGTNEVTAFDRSGQGNHGTLFNTATSSVRVPGKIGQALSFDGVDDFVDAGSGASLDDLGPMTISAWIKPESEGEGRLGSIVQKDISIASGFLLFRFLSSCTNCISFGKDYSSGDLTRTTASNFITLNEWQHLVLTWDGSSSFSNVHIYRNGAEASYGSGTDGMGTKNSDAALDLVIGNRKTGASTFDGSIDDVRIYNRILSPDEIKQLYRMGGGR